jgi:hypothetical protein
MSATEPRTETPSPGELSRLRSARTAAQAWVDTANDDVIKATRELETAREIQQRAEATRDEAELAYEQRLREAQHPISLRRAG